jgi:hypothetical protein
MFRFANNLNKFYFAQATTYQQYIFAVRYGAILNIEQLIPSLKFPCTLSFRFILYDNASLRHYHEHCASVVDLRNGTRWMDSMHYRFERPADCVGSVAQLKSVFWCAHSEKVLFSMPQRLPCQGLIL